MISTRYQRFEAAKTIVVRRQLVVFLLCAFAILVVADIAFFFHFAQYRIEEYQPIGEGYQEHYVPFKGPVFVFIARWVIRGWVLIEHNHDAILATFTILIFVVTALLAAYTYRLWRETKTLREDADQ